MSQLLKFLSSYCVLIYTIWFGVDIAIHSLSDLLVPYNTISNNPTTINTINNNPLVSLLTHFTVISHTVFMIQGLLLLGALSIIWYTEFTRTRAARSVSVIVQIYCTVSWLLNLVYYINSLDSNNPLCNNTIIDIPSNYCQLSRATTGLAILLEFGHCCLLLYSIIVYSVPIIKYHNTNQKLIIKPYKSITYNPDLISIGSNPNIINNNTHHYYYNNNNNNNNISINNSDNNTTTINNNNNNHTSNAINRTKILSIDSIDYEDDCSKSAENRLNNQSIKYRILGLNWLNWFLILLTLGSYCIICYSYIDIAKDTITANNNPAAAGNTDRLIIDDVFNSTIRLLSILLIFSISLGCYCSYRRNRILIATASLIAFINSLTFTTIIIYLIRRLSLLTEDITILPGINDQLRNIQSNQSITAGITIIAITELIRSIVLLIRYNTYVPIITSELLQNNPNPNTISADYIEASYTVNKSTAATVFSSNNKIPLLINILFYLHLFTLLTSFIVEILLQSMNGLFNPIPLPNGLFFPLQISIVLTAPIIILNSILFIANYITIYRAIQNPSYTNWYSSIRVNIISLSIYFLYSWPVSYNLSYTAGLPLNLYCNSSNELLIGIHYCTALQSIGILSLISIGLLACSTIISMIQCNRFYSYQLFSANNYTSIQSILLNITIIGILLSALSSINIGLTAIRLNSIISANTLIVVNNYSPFVYWSSIILPIGFLLLFTSYYSALNLSSLFYQNYYSMRYITLGLLIMTIYLLIPSTILTIRFITNNIILNSNYSELIMAIGFIILTAGLILTTMNLLYNLEFSVIKQGIHSDSEIIESEKLLINAESLFIINQWAQLQQSQKQYKAGGGSNININAGGTASTATTAANTPQRSPRELAINPIDIESNPNNEDSSSGVNFVYLIQNQNPELQQETSI